MIWGIKKEEEEATNTFEMHFIELPKFKEKNPDYNTKLEQWLWLIDGSKEEKVEMSAKENEEVNKTVKELNKLSKDPDEIAKYEEREWSIMRYNVEMKTNRELGEKDGEARGREEGRREGEKTTKEKNCEGFEKYEFIYRTDSSSCRINRKRSRKNIKSIEKIKVCASEYIRTNLLFNLEI